MEKKLIKLTSDLVKIRSLSGQEEKIAEFIKDTMLRSGYDTVKINNYNTVTGIIKGKKPGKTILLDAHIDHVDVNNEELWKHKPYQGIIDNDRIWGRATSDMKGSLAAMICAGIYFAKNKNEFSGNIVISGTSWEELFEGFTLGVEISELKKEGYYPDLVVIGEASDLNLKIAQRGRAEILIKSIGKSCHSSNPEKGINAVYNAFELINCIKKVKLPSHDFVGKAIMELTDIISKPYPGSSVVPEECIITYDRRLMPGETKGRVINDLKRSFSALKNNNKKLKISVKLASGEIFDKKEKMINVEKFAPGWCFSKDNEFVRKTYSGLKRCGLNPKITKYSFCTNGSMSAGILKIPTVGFGPSPESMAHIVDEYVEIDQLVKTYKGYVSIIKEFKEV